MNRKSRLKTVLLVSCVTFAMTLGTARADEVPLVTGEHWMKSNEQVKKAYLVGIANLAQVEMAYGGVTPASDTHSILPRMARGLKGQTLDSVRDALDRWYAAHPDRTQRPVIETIWFELVVPGLKKS